MKKRIIIILCIISIIAIIIGLLLSNKIEITKKNQIEIIDATYSCNQIKEKFYEDDTYIYYYPCQKSSSVFVKFSNNNKLLVTDALKEEKVTINELIKAGLEVIKEKK